MIYLVGQAVHQLAELRLLIGSLVGMNHALFGSLVVGAGAIAQQSGGGSGIAGSDSSAEFLFNGFESAFTGAVAGVGLAAGAHPFDRGLQMCHLLSSLFFLVIRAGVRAAEQHFSIT